MTQMYWPRKYILLFLKEVLKRLMVVVAFLCILLTERQRERETHRERQRQRERERQRERQTDRQTDRQTETER